MKNPNGSGGQAMALMPGMRRAAASKNEHAEARFPGGRVRARLCSGSEGQAIVEFALVMPVLLMLLTAIFMFSIATYNAISLQTAVGQGVQVMATGQNIVDDPCGNATTVIDTATTLNASLITIKFYAGGSLVTAGAGGSCAGLTTGTEVTVTATYPCSLAIYNFARSCQLTASESEPVP